MGDQQLDQPGEQDQRIPSMSFSHPPPPLPPTSAQSQKPQPPPSSLPAGSQFVARARSALDKRSMATKGPSTDVDNWNPTIYFFYGSLMDPQVLQAILSLPKEPEVERGYITGFKIKMWGIYPTLVPVDSEESTTVGTFWTVHKEAHAKRLSSYETKAYTTTEVTITELDGNATHQGRTFFWAGDADSPDLEDGSFDLAVYQQLIKPSLLRRAAG